MVSFFKKHREGILYVLFGCGTTLSNWITYCMCVEVLHLDITLSNALACFVSIIFAFITNKIFVFRSTARDAKTVTKEAVSFLASRSVTGIIDVFAPTLLIYLGVTGTVFGIDGFIAKLLSSVLVIVLNYILSKLFVFKKKKA